MCIIVDADCVHDLKLPTDDGKPVLKWLLTGRGGLIVGGKLKRELVGLRETMVALDRAGRLKKLDDDKVDGLAKKLATEKRCGSNDHHVIAAAILSKCTLIFSKDAALHADAKDKKLLDPPASIYQCKDHKHLLTECKCD